MAKRNEATRLLKTGMYLDEIATTLGVSFQTIDRYLKHQVAEGALKVSDVFFGIRPDHRALLEQILLQTGDVQHASKKYYVCAREHGMSWDEANLYWSLRDARIPRGDMYEHIADLEETLHALIRKTLEDEFGATESSWWRKGVPLAVRKYCVQAREDDPDPVSEAFAYTTFINLSDILDKNWSLFSKVLPKTWSENRKQLMSDLLRLNHIRNAVMHPVKKKRWTEDDFALVNKRLNQLMTVVSQPQVSDRSLKQSVRFALRSKAAKNKVKLSQR